MKMRVFVLTVLLVTVVSASVPAQDAKPPLAAKAPALPRVSSNDSPDQRAEDIEIMRRLLQRTLAKHQQNLNVSPSWNNSVGAINPTVLPNNPWTIANSPWPSGVTFDQWAGNPTAPLPTNSYNNYMVTNSLLSLAYAPALPEIRGPEGVYLKGYGVVYTATLGLPTVPVVATANRPSPKPLTEWERTRRELRGEKIETVKPESQETLADAVLKVLARNGQHFSQLGETEQITVALTLPQIPSSVKAGNTWSNKQSAVQSYDDFGNPIPGNSEPNKLLADEIKAMEEKLKTAKSDFQKEVLLGDLHMKNGKNEQAATSFESALRLYGSIVDLHRRLGQQQNRPLEKDAQLEKSFLESAAKLLQVYAALGKTDQVQTILKTLERQVQQAKAAEAASKPPEAPAKEELPGKLVISASKKLLDLVGTGQITFEEFRKNATVDYQPPRVIESKSAKPASDQK